MPLVEDRELTARSSAPAATRRALHSRFLACVASIGSRDDAIAIAARIDHLEKILDNRALTSLPVGSQD